jgi:hypothetical protein
VNLVIFHSNVFNSIQHHSEMTCMSTAAHTPQHQTKENNDEAACILDQLPTYVRIPRTHLHWTWCSCQNQAPDVKSLLITGSDIFSFTLKSNTGIPHYSALHLVPFCYSALAFLSFTPKDV